MRKQLLGAAVVSGALVIGIASWSRAGDSPAKTPEVQGSQAKREADCCDTGKFTNPALTRIKALNGTWVKADGSQKLVFKTTAAGSAVMETMFPGTQHEMVNLYAIDGEKSLMVTHYCAMGVQPRMKLVPSDDPKTMKFEFVDGGNIPSRDAAHMDSLTLTIDGDKLTEDWTYYQDGKTVSHTTFELQRQAEAKSS